MAKKKKNEFVCQDCGYISPKYLGRCPNCGEWNTLVEEIIQEKPTRHSRVSLTGESTKPKKLDKIVFEKETRVKTE
ncbi:MAG: DNA repair protein RadA, partial [Vagococcus sp.]